MALRPQQVVLAVALVAAVALGAVAIADVAGADGIAGIGAESEPPRLSVESVERLDVGCADDVATYASSRTGGGSVDRVGFVETGDAAANLSVATERTSPRGARLSAFRVYIDSAAADERADSDPTANGSDDCRVGIQYRVRLSYEPRSSGPLSFGDEGTRVLWLENGEYVGCSGVAEGSLETECARFLDGGGPERTWANGTA
ncbi:hypothetical protein SAMN04488067_10678 [Halorubrum xinjiangense]|uniref:Uncharacterized protein n=1 Tax=Halorubrum xinjiangense TaxID=261291 RepID=A0A1G7MJI2_9EURY|nr:hypothetical protein [Halorubrum xinjiangense]SDF61309.1 hypothetical protein SAMN04488067_10678 [Halorubrum xinjiangense]